MCHGLGLGLTQQMGMVLTRGAELAGPFGLHWQEWLRELGWLSLEKRRLRGELPAAAPWQGTVAWWGLASAPK